VRKTERLKNCSRSRGAAENRGRQALYAFVVNFFGLSVGPTTVVLITDYAFHDENMVGHVTVIDPNPDRCGRHYFTHSLFGNSSRRPSIRNACDFRLMEGWHGR
jgi:hypothetical protein